MTGVRGRVLLPALLAGFVAMQLMPVAAQAQQQGEDRQRGWFFEMGIGQIKDRNDLATGVDTGGAPYMKRGYLGYAITRFFGIEGGVVDTSKIEYNDPVNSAGLGVMSAKGIHGKVFFTIPFSRDPDGFTGVTFTGGGWRWDAQFASASPAVSDFHETGIAPTASVGLIFAGRTSAVRLEYERFFLKPKNIPAGIFAGSADDKLTYDVVSVNLQFFF